MKLHYLILAAASAATIAMTAMPSGSHGSRPDTLNQATDTIAADGDDDSTTDQVVVEDFEVLSSVYPGRPVLFSAQVQNSTLEDATITLKVALRSGATTLSPSEPKVVAIDAYDSKMISWAMGFEGSDALTVGDTVTLSLISNSGAGDSTVASVTTEVKEYAPEARVNNYRIPNSKLLDGIYEASDSIIKFSYYVGDNNGEIADRLAVAIYDGEGNLDRIIPTEDEFTVSKKNNLALVQVEMNAEGLAFNNIYKACIVSCIGGTPVPFIADGNGECAPSTVLSFKVTEPTILPEPDEPFSFIKISNLAIQTAQIVDYDFGMLVLPNDVEQRYPGIVAAKGVISGKRPQGTLPTLTDGNIRASLINMYGDSINFTPKNISGQYNSLRFSPNFSVMYSVSNLMQLGGRYRRHFSMPGFGFEYSDTVDFKEKPIIRYLADKQYKRNSPFAIQLFVNTGFPYDIESLNGSETASVVVKHYDTGTGVAEEYINLTSPLDLNSKKMEYLAAQDTLVFTIGNDAPLGKYTADVTSSWGDIKRSLAFEIIDTVTADVELDNVEYAPTGTINARLTMRYGYPFIHATGDDELPTVRIINTITAEDSTKTELYCDTIAVADAAFALAEANITKDYSIDLSKCDFGDIPEEGKEFQMKVEIRFNGEKQFGQGFYLLATGKPTGVATPLKPIEQVEDNAFYRIDGVRIDTSRSNLAPGLYIHRGRKIIITH